MRISKFMFFISIICNLSLWGKWPSWFERSKKYNFRSSSRDNTNSHTNLKINIFLPSLFCHCDRNDILDLREFEKVWAQTFINILWFLCQQKRENTELRTVFPSLKAYWLVFQEDEPAFSVLGLRSVRQGIQCIQRTFYLS